MEDYLSEKAAAQAATGDRCGCGEIEMRVGGGQPELHAYHNFVACTVLACAVWVVGQNALVGQK